MSEAVKLRPHLQAVIDLLNDAELQDAWSPEPIEFGRDPEDVAGGWLAAPQQSPFQGYGLVSSIGARDSRNRNADDNRGTEGFPLISVACFGGWREQVEDALDLVHEQMMAQTLTVPGRHVVYVNHDNSTTPLRSEKVETPRFDASKWYRIRTRPAD